MRIIGNILGCCLVAMGAIWILQGLNILPGSFMTGNMLWAYRGAAAAACGVLVVILTWAMTRRQAR